jgi:hypothetical protein
MLLHDIQGAMSTEGEWWWQYETSTKRYETCDISTGKYRMQILDARIGICEILGVK